MAPLPSVMSALTLSAFTGLPFTSLSRLNKPLRPGPILTSVESALWQTEQFSKAASPFFASPSAAVRGRPAVSSRARLARARIPFS